MQALTLSIGQAGIDHFSQTFVADELKKKLSNMPVPDRTIKVGDFSDYGAGYTDSFYNINIFLTAGKLVGYNPTYQSVTQLSSGNPAGSQFQLSFTAPAFSAAYQWQETGSESFCTSSPMGGGNCNNSNVNQTIGYAASIDSLLVQVTLSFKFDLASDSYEIVAAGESAQPGNISANIPGNSVIQNEDSSCFSSHVSAATSQAISSIDFQDAVASVVPSLLKGIPASGDLGNGIVFDFGLGDSRMAFSTASGQNGITIGISGGVSYNGVPYPGVVEQALPLPPIPLSSSSDHLQTYVSDYSVNGLQWAYFEAGLLNATATPGTLPDPAALKCKNYVNLIPAFKPYAPFSMQADIKPLSAPVTVFQEYWDFTQTVINSLQPMLPASAYAAVAGQLNGNIYLSQDNLTSDLEAYGIDPCFFPIISNAGSNMGMVVQHDLQFVLTILNEADVKPTITFSVQRTDIQSNLVLGNSGVQNSLAQTLQFSYVNQSFAATFISSTVPNFPDGETFANVIWPAAGESAYDQTLAAMGAAGVPIPIMSGFAFVFADANLSVQQGYVSIQAQVEQKTSSAAGS